MCYYCDAINGQVRKGGALKIVHDKYKAYNSSTSARKKPPDSKILFDISFNEAKKGNQELEKHIRKAIFVFKDGEFLKKSDGVLEAERALN